MSSQASCVVSRIAFALDTSDLGEASKLIELLDPYVDAYKVGLEYFIANRTLPTTSKPIILDLKLHDIPNTVARAIESAAKLGAKYLTLHIQQRETLLRAREVANKHGIVLLGVSVLSSMTDDDVVDVIGVEDVSVSHQISVKVALGYDCGLRGFVCSPREIGKMKAAYPDAFWLVPGVRSSGVDVGDQRRIGTPLEAIRDGASMIVVGREVRCSDDPVSVMKRIHQDIGER